MLAKDYATENEGKMESESKTDSDSKVPDEGKVVEAPPISSTENKLPEFILTEDEEKKPANIGKEEGLERINEQPLWETETILPEKECPINEQEDAPNTMNGH
jgi:hypothetical protein